MENPLIEAVSLPATLRARFGAGLTFSLVAAVFNSGSTLLVNIAVAKLLGREVLGEFATVVSTLLTLSTMASLGTAFTATKYVAEFRSADRARAGRVLALCSTVTLLSGAMCSALLFFASSSIATAALKNPGLSSGLALGSAAVLLNASNSFHTGALAGLESFRAIAIAGMVGGTSYFLFGTGGAYLGGRNGALGGIVLSLCLQALMLAALMSSELRRWGITLTRREMGRERHAILGFALPSALSGLSTMPALWLATAVLVRQPGGYQEMALYTAATNLRMLVLFVPRLVNSVGMSLINNAKAEASRRRYMRVFWVNMAVVCATTLAGAAVVALLGPHLLSLFGRDFRSGYSVLLVLLLASLFEAGALAAYQPLQSEGRMWLSMVAVGLPRDALLVALAWLLAPGHGALGLGVAQATSGGVSLIAAATIAAVLIKSSPMRQ